MSLKTLSRSKAIHIMLVYTGGCNGCDIEIVNAVLEAEDGRGEQTLLTELF